MTMPTPTTYGAMLPLHFEVPAVNPTGYGLYGSTLWTEIGPDEPSRHLAGVEVRGFNYASGRASGVWDAPWCEPPALNGPCKEGERQTILDVFDPITVWAYDECDLTEPSRAEVQQRAAHVMRREEQTLVEREFAERLKLDALDLGAAVTRPTLKEAVAYLDGEAAKTGTALYFHVGAHLVATEAGMFKKNGTRFTSPLGNVWIVGGGYVDGLGDQIVATSQPFGWRDQVQVRTAIDERHNTFAAIAERSVNIGYEALIAVVTITPPTP